MSEKLVDALPSALELRAVDALIQSLEGPILEWWPGAKNPRARKLQILNKPDGSQVTSADLWSHEKLIEGLNRLFPGDHIVSEEGKDDFTIDTQRTWVLDPIDGTTHFINGRTDFAILCGLVVGGIPIAGWMNLPALGVRAFGAIGHGAIWNGRPVRASVAQSIDPRRIHVRGMELVADLKNADTANTYIEVIEQLLNGGFDAAIFGGGGFPWDNAAPAVILSESGLLVTDLQGAPLPYRDRTEKSPILAASPAIHHSLVALLSR